MPAARRIPNYTGTITFSTSDTGAGVALPPSYTFTAADAGTHTFTNGVTLSTPGVQTIAVLDGSTPTALTGSTTVQAGHGVPARLAVSAPSPSLIKPGQPFGVTVSALDAQGNVDVDYLGTVSFTTTDPSTSVVLPGSYTFTAADRGVHTFANGFTLATAGIQTISVKDNLAPPTTGTATVQVPHGSATKLVVGVRPTIAVAGAPFTISLTAEDAFGNVDTGYAGMLVFSSTDPSPSVVLPGSYVFTTADAGKHTFNNAFILDSAGSQTITIKDNANSSIATNVTVQVSHAATSRIVASFPTSGSVGVPMTLALTAYDPFGNIDTSYSGTVKFATTDKGTGVVLPAAYTFVPGDAGQHTFTNGITLVTTGNQTVTITDTNNNTIKTTAGGSLAIPSRLLPA